MTPLEALKEYFGYTEFRPLQADIVGAIRNKRDTFALLPTGAGKSLCYQLPSVLVNDGVTIVVSPLIALMKDQVDALTQLGIPAAFLNSTQSAGVQQQVMERLQQHQLRLLYVAPERLVQDSFLQLIQRLRIQFFAIDEAHCISQWGHDFRPEYRQLTLLRKQFPATPIVALTATATERVKKDIVTQLSLQSPAIFVGSFNRPNLSYTIYPKQSGNGQLLQLLATHRGQSGIVYCQSRKLVEELTQVLNRAGHSALPYHAGLEDDVRRENQEKYIRDDVEVMVATVAFGMGINKPDVRFVIHYNLPKSIEHYYQETGRAGRDGLPSQCYLLFSYADKILYERFIREMQDNKEQLIAKQQLDLMLSFAQSQQCRRMQLLQYFGEMQQVTCANCDNCLSPRETYDATIQAQQILSCVVRTGQRFAATHVADVLKGSKNKKVVQFGHDKLSTYGLMKERDVKQIKLMIYDLVQQGLLVQSSDQFATLTLGTGVSAVLKGEQKVQLPKYQEVESPTRAVVSDSVSEYDFELFDVLRQLRKEVAAEKGLPPYMIFADRTLQDMARVMPQSIDEMMRVFGVGEKKAEVYGLRFIDAIEHYCDRKGIDRSKTIGTMVPKTVTTAPIKEDVTSTVIETIALYRQGCSIDEIAEKRGLKIGTIHEHLVTAYADGEEIDVDALVSKEKQEVIAKAIEEHATPFLGPIKRALGEEYSYDEIRWMRAKLARNK